jgi:hypothetical protein
MIVKLVVAYAFQECCGMTPISTELIKLYLPQCIKHSKEHAKVFQLLECTISMVLWKTL